MSRKRGEEVRFIDIDWYCDRCNAYLNGQPGFSDRHYVWKCTKCGYKSSISRDNIISNEARNSVLGHILGWIRSVLVYCIIISVLWRIFGKELGFLDKITEYLVYYIIGYGVVQVLSMLFERLIAHCCADTPVLLYIISTPFVNLVGDVLRPVIESWKSLINIITFPQYRIGSFLFKRILWLVAYLPLVISLAYSILKSVV